MSQLQRPVLLNKSIKKGLYSTPIQDQDALGFKPVLISQKERETSKLSSKNLGSALAQFHRCGIAILSNAVAVSKLDHIRERMLIDIPRNLESPNVHYNHGKAHKNVSQTPPLCSEYLHSEVWANSFAIELISHIIGPLPQLAFATSNIALPDGLGRQAVHSDYYCEHFDFPVFLEVSIFLENVSKVNGSLEIWLGTHNGYNKKDHLFPNMGWIKRQVFLDRATISPPFQPSIPKGSILIRDLRLWHAGMPNYTQTPRIMLGFIYSPRWFPCQMRLQFPATAISRVKSWTNIDTDLCNFTAEPINYLETRQNLNLTSVPDLATEKYIPRHGVITPSPYHYFSRGDRD